MHGKIMYCHCCGPAVERDISYHEACLRKLFGVDYLSTMDLSLKEVNIKAQVMVGKLSIPGVQVKLSVKLNKKEKKLDIVSEGGEFILKPQINSFVNIPENENLCMTIANNSGITVPGHCLIKLTDDTWAYIVKRYDRKDKRKIHQEDFCQILGVPTEKKYGLSIESIAKKLKEISDVPGLDLQLLLERLLFFFLVGNGDAHLKNFSIIYNDKGDIRLAPAYDIVSSRLAILEEKEEFALSINGKKNNITRKDFDLFADRFEINKDICYENVMKKNLVFEFIGNSQLPEDQNKRLQEIVNIRYSKIFEK